MFRAPTHGCLLLSRSSHIDFATCIAPRDQLSRYETALRLATAGAAAKQARSQTDQRLFVGETDHVVLVSLRAGFDVYSNSIPLM